ncbi:hypothetical protein MPSI1_003152 [Malassezia psittaci]|uniref:Major facilitator superfamily (MFS) profile domain-containing protein n=1 Tax=Malassezia psittaci TaxID=1821823 RepID=A0AAF0FCX7_9BASI|nr:hypothetical protein MPSI1_003152 [Malassezia psittaci]
MFKGTAFGTLLNLISGGKLLKTEAQRRDKFWLTQDIEHGRDPEEVIVTWHGENDVECPYNWPTWYKCWVTLLLYIMTLSVYMGSSVVSPAITDISEDFQISQVTAALSMSLFVWGYGFGPMVLSPITDISWVGRNGPYIVGLGLFTMLQIPTALVKNAAGLLILRFLAGFFGSPVLATGAASIGDVWRMDGGFMNALAFWNWGASGGPTVGPMLVSFAVSKLGWRWSIWPLLCLNGLNWMLLFFALPETSSSAILTRRAKQIRKQTGNSKYRSAAEIKDGELEVTSLLYETLCRPIQLTLTEPVLLCSNLYIAYVYGIVYCFFEAYPMALQERHGFSLGLLGVAYVSGFVGSGTAFGLYCIYNTKLAYPRWKEGRWKPEYRMEPAFSILVWMDEFWRGTLDFVCDSVFWEYHVGVPAFARILGVFGREFS